MHTINDLKIDKLVNRNIFTMSGGEKQALAFASIYTVNPEIYVLDEPTANLDQKSIQILKKTTRKKSKVLAKQSSLQIIVFIILQI
ncbi:ATP-binding cassette domain-containing protein [Clostridium botulinum]|nr:ATP-binding cassette domain-containing protein [Clostridium botulinum]